MKCDDGNKQTVLSIYLGRIYLSSYPLCCDLLLSGSHIKIINAHDMYISDMERGMLFGFERRGEMIWYILLISLFIYWYIHIMTSLRNPVCTTITFFYQYEVKPCGIHGKERVPIQVKKERKRFCCVLIWIFRLNKDFIRQ